MKLLLILEIAFDVMQENEIVTKFFLENCLNITKLFSIFFNKDWMKPQVSKELFTQNGWIPFINTKLSDNLSIKTFAFGTHSDELH